MSNSRCLVSVVMITYGHEAYIRKAIEGVLMQDCNFDVELIIANDCSPDQTDKIVFDLIDNHAKSNWIKYTRHTSNKGMMTNAIWALKQCESKYIALCEGDDYWTDPLKLQKQVDFLEENDDYGICAHQVLASNQFSNTERIFPLLDADKDYDVHDFIIKNYVGTCSLVFKRKQFSFSDWYTKSPFGDLLVILVVMLNTNQKIKVFKEVMGIYRIHSGGVNGKLHQNNYKLSYAYQQHITFINLVQKELFKGEFNKTIYKKKLITFNTIVSLISKRNQPFRYLKFRMLAFMYNKFNIQ